MKIQKVEFFILILFVGYFDASYSQSDSLNFKRSISININDLFIKRILFNYTIEISPRK
jgi:hypothetical protein